MFEKIAAGITDFGELEEIGGGKERLNVVLTHFNGARVDE